MKYLKREDKGDGDLSPRSPFLFSPDTTTEHLHYNEPERIFPDEHRNIYLTWIFIFWMGGSPPIQHRWHKDYSPKESLNCVVLHFLYGYNIVICYIEVEVEFEIALQWEEFRNFSIILVIWKLKSKGISSMKPTLKYLVLTCWLGVITLATLIGKPDIWL